jgi:hypothetical protein
MEIPPLITQSELAWYKELKTRSEEASKWLAEARERLILGVAEGVEPGEYRLSVVPRERQTFSYAGVAGVVGEAMADRIKEGLPVKSSLELTVTGPFAV